MQNNRICYRCSGVSRIGSKMLSCRKCKYDVCDICHEGLAQRADPVPVAETSRQREEEEKQGRNERCEEKGYAKSAPEHEVEDFVETYAVKGHRC